MEGSGKWLGSVGELGRKLRSHVDTSQSFLRNDRHSHYQWKKWRCAIDAVVSCRLLSSTTFTLRELTTEARRQETAVSLECFEAFVCCNLHLLAPMSRRANGSLAKKRFQPHKDTASFHSSRRAVWICLYFLSYASLQRFLHLPSLESELAKRWKKESKDRKLAPSQGRVGTGTSFE